MDILYKSGDIIEGLVSNITSYGGFVHVDYETSGLIHISEITNGFVSDIHDYLKVGQKVYCKVLEVDVEKHHLKLSLRNIPKNAKPRFWRRKKMMSKKENTPANNIGFSSIAKALPQWIKEQLNND